MTARDIQLTDILKPANILYKTPTRTAATAIQSGLYRNVFKHLFDIVIITCSLIVVLPLILTLALLVALDGGKPFYAQQRVGKGGRIFWMWKLRTMVRDADEALELHLEGDPEMRAEWDTKQKLLKDPRITPIGRILRKTSIDELPQLFNVLRGDMSLVGPRPMMVDQQELYPGQDYYQLRPGITGFWQISDRNQTSFAARAFYDNRYNTRMSFKTDVKTLWATIRVVVCGTGC